MKKKQFDQILKKYNEGEATPEEIAFLDAYYNAFGLHSTFVEDTKSKESVQFWNAIKEEIDHRIEGHLPVSLKSDKHRFYKRWAIAVAAVISVICGLYFWENKQASFKVEDNAMNKNDIGPGKQGATLTLANGKKIVLSDAINGELVKEAGVTISKTADGQIMYKVSGSDVKTNTINILSTARGETYIVMLPDDTKVWLNAASTLKYPVSFASLKERRVELFGEAYFEVAKDKQHPFIVKTEKQEVEVLGTHFNIKSYADEADTKTTLLEGSVKVVSAANKNNFILKPSQQAVLSNSGFKIQEADIAEAIAWKDGYFRFKDEDLKSIMLKLSRWYDVEVKYEANVSTKEFSGKLSRSNHISEILKALETTKGVHFNVEGRRVTVMQ
jgi:transmembrane sensor